MSAPRITAVVAVYGVEEYLPAFLDSLDWQTCPDEEIEIVFVDDASPDESIKLVQQWADGKRNVRVLKNLVNGGAAEARRRGYAAAAGEWVTSVDPDDILDPDYFFNVLRLMDDCSGQNVAMYTSRVMPFNEVDGRPRDNHPLGYKYKNGDRLVALSEAPSSIQLGATAFIRTEVLRKAGLEFDARVRPTFEDGALLARYLLEFKDPVVALVSSAHYYYRKRGTGGSLVQSGWKQRAKYIDQLRYGYIPALAFAEAKFGAVPEWLQFTVLYDLSWYFTEDLKLQGSTEVLHQDKALSDAFVSLLEEVFSYFRWETIASFDVRGLPWNIRETLLIRFFGQDFGGARLTSWGKQDDVQSFSLVTRENPGGKVELLADGRRVTPELQIVSRHYFGHILSYETYFKYSAENLAVLFDDRIVVPVAKVAKAPKVVLSEAHKIKGQKAISRGRAGRFERLNTTVQVASLAVNKAKPKAWAKMLVDGARRRENKLRQKVKPAYLETFHKVAASQPVRERFRDAWLIMDRPRSANDNGEHFYRWLKENHPEKNAYFVLSKDAEAWARLEAEGFRLLDYGSFENKLAYFNAEVIVSSDAIADVMYHAKRSTYGNPQIPFVFLQHGVVRYDISTWLNPKKIDLIIASTEAEAQYFSSYSSPYHFTPDQVALTGLSRFDRLVQLREAKEQKPGSTTRTVSFMPTWRSNLKKVVDSVTEKRAAAKLFQTSEFAKAWESVFAAPSIVKAAEQGEIAINFVLHPNFDEFIDFFKLPDFVNILSIQNVDFQKLLVDSDLFITDYSSAAFDAAVAGAEISYYQFDWEDFYSGGHTQRPGYYTESRDGFGPTFFDSEAFLGFLSDWLSGTQQADVRYLERIADMQSHLVGHARKNTFEAIEQMLDNRQTNA